MSNPNPEITSKPTEGEPKADSITSTAETSSSDAAALKAEADRFIAEGKKAIALQQWEDGVARYADALDIMRQLVGESDPKMAPLLLSYGKALYELAFSLQGVMGKEEVNRTAGQVQGPADDDDDAEGPSGSNFTFAEPTFEDEDGGDHDDTEEAEGVEAGPSSPRGAGADEPEGEEEGEVDGDEPEDDYNAAWEVLDIARTIYTKLVEAAEGKEGVGRSEEEMTEVKLNLAECYLALGDVSCETENFPQAVQDYTSALLLKSSLLPPSSRALASVHYQLATVLEFTPNRRDDALSHVQKALEGFKLLKAELESSLGSSSSTTATASDSTRESSSTITKTTTGADANLTQEVRKLSPKERESELKDVKSLMEDLEVKIEELKTAPQAGDLVSESINHLLGGGGDVSSSAFSFLAFGGPNASGGAEMPVNNLNSMVKKKAPKKAANGIGSASASTSGIGNGNGIGNGSGSGSGSAGANEEQGQSKRKAEEGELNGVEKKAKVD